MSIDEIIEIIEELQCEYKEQEDDKKYNEYTVFKAKRYSKGLQGLLDLYNKEKEENNKLKTCNGILDVFSLGKESSRQRIEYDWVEKDKIKDKIKEIEMLKKIDSSTKYTQKYTHLALLQFGINQLQELLEGE